MSRDPCLAKHNKRAPFTLEAAEVSAEFKPAVVNVHFSLPTPEFLALLITAAAYGHRFPPNAPIVCINFINDNDSGQRVLVQHIDQQLGNTCDELSLLVWRDAVTGDFDVHVGHGFLDGWEMVRVE